MNYDNQQQPEKPGVKRRREELAAAQSEQRQYRRERGGESARTGSVETRQNVAKKKANLQRLLDALKKRGN